MVDGQVQECPRAKDSGLTVGMGVAAAYSCDLSPPKSQRSVSSHFSQKYTGSDLLRESIIGPVQLGHSGLSIATGGTLE
jgi:hypothetical protein